MGFEHLAVAEAHERGGAVGVGALGRRHRLLGLRVDGLVQPERVEVLAQAAEGAHEVHNTLEIAAAVGVARSDGVRKIMVEDPRRRGSVNQPFRPGLETLALDGLGAELRPEPLERGVDAGGFEGVVERPRPWLGLGGGGGRGGGRRNGDVGRHVGELLRLREV